ncbi:MAG: DUF58 domain-containing protein [Actinomycetota bacterium]|nr:DUF58 domain-containing protein [Actinomycetota bacterium]
MSQPPGIRRGWLASGWQPTVALVGASGTVALLLFLAVALHRPDLIVIAAPVTAGLVMNLARRPGSGVRALLRADAGTLLEDQVTTLTLRVSAPESVDLIQATTRAGTWMALSGDRPTTCHLVPAGAALIVTHGARALRWGRTRSGSAEVTASAAQGLLRCDAKARNTPVRILPLRERFHAIDAMPQAAGNLGAHRSRRPGDGTDLAGVRPFVGGDRLKRINWPVSLRTGHLHVTATVSDRDTAVMIVLDSSVDVTSGGTPTGGSLDIAVHAAASLAEHYLHSGDRVGLLDHAQPLRPIRPAAGRAHLDRMVDALLDVTPRPSSDDYALPRVLARIAPRATVMLLSPLLGAARPERALAFAQAGHAVLVIDTLGDQRPTEQPREWTDLAWRLQLLQRTADIDRLGEHGIPVVAWRGAGSLDEVLRRISRAANAPRVRT